MKTNKISLKTGKKIFFNIAITAILLFSCNVFSQEEFPLGSPYTAFGLGDMQYMTSTRTEAMGILGIALPGSYINNLNPASNSDLQLTSVSLSFNYGFLQLPKSNISDGNVNGINLGIPLSTKHGFVMNFGFNSMIRANYKIYSTITTPENITYNQTYAGNGGVSRINFGLSYKLFGSIALGADYNYAFGNQTKLAYLDFGSSLYQNTYIRKEDNLTGSFVKGGIVIDLKKLTGVESMNDFNLGFVYQSKLKLNSNQDAIYSSSIGNDTVNTESSDIQVPQAFGFGISKKIGKQVTLAGDFFMQQWKDFVPGNLAQTSYTNSMRYGLGVEISPALKSDKTFWESVTYRMGVSYDKTYFTINDQNINRYGVSFGLGIPISSGNSIDLGVSYSIRGKNGDGLIQEKYLKFTAGLNFSELWFVRPKDEDK